MASKLIVRLLIIFIINALSVPLALANDALVKIVQHKTYVGVVPYYQVNNKIYVLLGRETKDSRKVDAGVYADFGSTVKINDTTILQKAVNTLKHDTMGKLKLSELDLLRSGRIMHKQVDQDHDAYYIFYKLSQQQFLRINKLKVQHARLNASGIANTNLEKDHFVWFNFEDLLQQTSQEPEVNSTIAVHTIDGKKVTVNLRKYFILDCLLNPELSNLSGSL